MALALGLAGLPRRREVHVAMLFAGFETAMPLIGIALNGLIYLAIAILTEGAAIRRKAIIAAVASTIASLVMGTGLPPIP